MAPPRALGAGVLLFAAATAVVAFAGAAEGSSMLLLEILEDVLE